MWNYQLKYQKQESEESATNSVNNILEGNDDKTSGTGPTEKKIGLVREIMEGIFAAAGTTVHVRIGKDFQNERKN